MATFDRSTLKQTRWLLAIVVGVVLAFGFVRLGLWQLDRLDQRREANVAIESRGVDHARPLAGLVGSYGLDAEQLTSRLVEVEGTYRADEEFFSIGRTYDNLTGTLVITPLDLDDGSVMMVVRGLVPATTSGPPAVGYEPPSGRVALVGRLDDGEEPLRIGEPDPDDGNLASISRIDLSFIDRWIEGDVLPISLLLDSQAPPNAEGTLLPVPVDQLSEGRHLGYAVQWFAFAVIVVFGIGALLWRAGTIDQADG